jgi:hypothetical protein
MVQKELILSEPLNGEEQKSPYGEETRVPLQAASHSCISRLVLLEGRYFGN